MALLQVGCALGSDVLGDEPLAAFKGLCPFGVHKCLPDYKPRIETWICYFNFFFFFFFFFFVHLFIYFTENKSGCEVGGGQRERENLRLPVECRTPCGALSQNLEIMT